MQTYYPVYIIRTFIFIKLAPTNSGSNLDNLINLTNQKNLAEHSESANKGTMNVVVHVNCYIKGFQ